MDASCIEGKIVEGVAKIWTNESEHSSNGDHSKFARIKLDF